MYFFLNAAIFLTATFVLIGARTVLTLIPNEHVCMGTTLVFLGIFIEIADETVKSTPWLWDEMSDIAVIAALLSAWLSSTQWRDSVSKRQFLYGPPFNH